MIYYSSISIARLWFGFMDITFLGGFEGTNEHHSFFLTHILSHLGENIRGNDWYEDSTFLSLSRHWRPWLQSSRQVVLIPSLRISQIHLATITSRAETHRAPLAKTEPVPWAWPMTKRGEDAGPQAHRSERRGWAAPAPYGPQAHQPGQLLLCPWVAYHSSRLFFTRSHNVRYKSRQPSSVTPFCRGSTIL